MASQNDLSEITQPPDHGTMTGKEGWIPPASKPTGGPHYGPARYWAVDLHVHTPASADAQPLLYGATTADEVVKAALDAGLDAIAITDHNTVEWCEQIATAAQGHPLVVLPGVEISTTEGHLLAIWEEGTPTDLMKDVLAKLDIGRSDQGKLDIAASVGFVDAARVVERSGGLAIAAHVDRPKGMLKLSVAAHLKKTLLDRSLAAIEVVVLDTIKEVRNKLGDQREIACVRGSDAWPAGGSHHAVGGIGNRRTWIKASRPDLRGIRHALADPSLRVSLVEPASPAHPIIKSLTVTGGFLDGQVFTFSPDMNCLLGGTGTGKSLVIELIRFALNQQAGSSEFPHVRDEVDSRLTSALGPNATVALVIHHGGSSLTVRRAFAGADSPEPEVVKDGVPMDSAEAISIRAFSQGEVIEYARAPVGRMILIDSALELVDLAEQEEGLIAVLAENSRKVATLRRDIKAAEEELAALPETKRRIDELARLFDADIVKQQAKWSKEKARFAGLGKVTELREPPQLSLSLKFKYPVENEANRNLYERVTATVEALRQTVTTINGSLQTAFAAANSGLDEVAKEWDKRFRAFEQHLAVEIAKTDTEGKGLAGLRRYLTDLQTKKAALEDAQTHLDERLRPRLQESLNHREQLIDLLLNTRLARRERRRERIKTLNHKMNGVVRIKLNREADRGRFREEIGELAKGTRLYSDVLDQLSAQASPVKLVRSYLDNDALGASEATGVELKHVERLFDHIREQQREERFLNLQAVEMPDGLSVEFRKPETQMYEVIERLAHGQKCTAILVIALADGDEPLIIDQPEDALHAPWIEEFLVGRLRELRGTRQYLLATRSPGLVVSADAEMIITLTSSATHGQIEASGSLERYELNRQALHHLEGGPQPFKRRTEKLAVSM